MHFRDNSELQFTSSGRQGSRQEGGLLTTCAVDPPVLPDPATATATAKPRAALAVDVLERVIVTGLYGWLVARIVLASAAGSGKLSALLLISEGLVVFFMLIRRQARDTSWRWTDWLIAFAATSAPLCVVPLAGRSVIHPTIGATLLLAGILIQLHAKVVLGRSFGLVPAHRGLKMTGPYQLVRHPMYFGYLLTHLAFLGMNPTGWNLLVYAICYSLQVPRLFAEEHLLSRDPDYRNYSEMVRYRLFPGIF